MRKTGGSDATARTRRSGMARVHVFADAARGFHLLRRGRPVDGRVTGGAESWGGGVAQWLPPGGEEESRRRGDELFGDARPAGTGQVRRLASRWLARLGNAVSRCGRC